MSALTQHRTQSDGYNPLWREVMRYLGGDKDGELMELRTDLHPDHKLIR